MFNWFKPLHIFPFLCSGGVVSNPVYETSAVTRVADLAAGATLNAPSGVVAGDLLLCSLAIDETNNNTVTFTDWNLLASSHINSPDGHSHKLYGRIATGSDSYVVSNSLGVAATTATIGRWSGASSTLPTNIVATTNTSSNTTPISASFDGLIASAGSSIGVFACVDQNPGTDTWGFSQITDYTERQDDAGGNWNSVSLQTRDGVTSGATGSLATTITRLSGSGNGGYLAFVVEIT